MRQAARVRKLLPVQPPEIHARLLQGVVRVVIESVEVLFAAGVERQRLLRGGVRSHGFHEIGVHLFVRLHAVGRMVVQRHVEPLLMEPLEEPFRIGNERRVPRVACPNLALAVRAGQARDVPVHVHDDDIEREIVLAVSFHNLPKILRRVPPIPGVPRAEDVLPRERHRAADARQGPQRRFVIGPVAEKIPVRVSVSRALPHPIARQERSLRIIQQVPAVPRQHALAQVHRAFHAVQRPDRPAQVLPVLLTGPPVHPIFASRDLRVQVLLVERLVVGMVSQPDFSRVNDRVVDVTGQFEIIPGGVAFDGEHGPVIHELAVLSIFDPDAFRRDDRKPRVADHHLRVRLSRIGDRRRSQKPGNEKLPHHPVNPLKRP